MACDAETLVNDTRCLATLGERQLLAAWAYLVCNAEPFGDSGRILEDGTPRNTEDDERRVIES